MRFLASLFCFLVGRSESGSEDDDVASSSDDFSSLRSLCAREARMSACFSISCFSLSTFSKSSEMVLSVRNWSHLRFLEVYSAMFVIQVSSIVFYVIWNVVFSDMMNLDFRYFGNAHVYIRDCNNVLL